RACCTLRACGVPARDPLPFRFHTRTRARHLQRPIPKPGGSSMETTFDRVEKTAKTQVTKMRWALGLNGLLAIAAGVVILLWPGISLYALTILFGAYALATGIVGLYYSFSAAKGERGWLVFSSLLGIAIGIIVFAWPNMSALALLYVIGAYAVVLGIL